MRINDSNYRARFSLIYIRPGVEKRQHLPDLEIRCVFHLYLCVIYSQEKSRGNYLLTTLWSAAREEIALESPLSRAGLLSLSCVTRTPLDALGMNRCAAAAALNCAVASSTENVRFRLELPDRKMPSVIVISAELLRVQQRLPAQ